MFRSDQWDQLMRDTEVKAVDYHEELGSTNDWALQTPAIDASGMPRLVITNQQTSGRGRQGSQWIALPGALTFSIVVPLREYRLDPHRVPQIALWTGLGVRDAIAQFVSGGVVQVKWPNDVYLNGRKVCGILVEHSSAQPQRAVVGIGLNVNNCFDGEAAPEIAPPFAAIAMADVAGKLDRCDVLTTLLQRVFESWELGAENRVSLSTMWQDHCFLRGRQVCCAVGSTRHEGVCVGVDDDGRLLLECQSRVIRLLGGTITTVAPGEPRT